MLLAALKKLFQKSKSKAVRTKQSYIVQSEKYQRQQTFKTMSRFGQSPVRMVKA